MFEDDAAAFASLVAEHGPKRNCRGGSSNLVELEGGRIGEARSAEEIHPALQVRSPKPSARVD